MSDSYADRKMRLDEMIDAAETPEDLEAVRASWLYQVTWAEWRLHNALSKAPFWLRWCYRLKWKFFRWV